jgi:hypothetical protein
MKKVSRFMPKVVRKKNYIVGWLILSPFLLALLYAFITKPVIVGSVITFLALWIYVNNFRHKNKLQKLASTRENESICTFTQGIDLRLIDTWVVRAVYEEIQGYLSSSFKNFPLRWNDDLIGDLMIDQGDLEDLIASDITERTNRSGEPFPNNPYYGKVKTVGDLVMLINGQPAISINF